ncbi:MAG: hypothetical protein WCP98_07425 [Actinomycetes bacterium]
MNMKLSAVGFALQSAKGAAEAQPEFWGPVGGGSLVTFALEQAEDELTSAEIVGPGEFRSSAAAAADYESRAWPQSIAGLLYAALGAIDSDPGSAPAVMAVLTTALAGANNDLTFLAKTGGTAGNSITVALVATGNDTPLSVDVASSAITVNLATGGAGAITSTASQVRAAINADTDAKALITASLAPGNSGVGVVTALSAANLAGGAAAGGGGTYTHVITPTSEVPWATVFGKKDSDRKAAVDCKLDELKIEWEGNQPLKVNATWAGCDADYAAADYTPGLDEALLDYFRGIHLSTATIDLDGNGYTGDAAILSGSLTIKRNLNADIYCGSLLAGDIFEAALEIDAELKVRVPDLLPVRLLLTGSEGGTAITGTVPYGEFDLVFSNAPDSLELAATRVAWKAGEPDADPKGGPAELTLTGRCYGSTPASVLTATVVNAHATY